VLSRRFEPVGEVAGVRVFDDHGNHPEPVRRTIRSLRALRPRRLHVVFEPHRNEAILRWGVRLARALEEADRVVLLPVDEEMITPRRLAPADWYSRGGLQAEPLRDRPAAVELLRRTVRKGDIVCFMGGRDSQAEVARALLKALDA
jgi:UDP-N-acetylmuramate--alanine ligase